MDEDGDTILPLFVQLKTDLPLVLWLLDEKGADVNVKKTGYTALHTLRFLNILNTLLDRGADPTLQDECWKTPLMQQASCGNVDLVVRLLQDPRVRATINCRSRSGSIALHHACGIKDEKSKPLIVRLLLQAGADPTIIDRERLTPLARLRRHYSSHQATIALLEEAPDAEKTWLIVKARRLLMTANNSEAVVPPYLQQRLARGQSLPGVELALLTEEEEDEEDEQDEDDDKDEDDEEEEEEEDEEDEEDRTLRTLMAFLVGIGGGPESGKLPRDVFRVVLDLLMPSWDPLRRGVVGTGSPVQG